MNTQTAADAKRTSAAARDCKALSAACRVRGMLRSHITDARRRGRRTRFLYRRHRAEARAKALEWAVGLITRLVICDDPTQDASETRPPTTSYDAND